jgi:hypothetical protein
MDVNLLLTLGDRGEDPAITKSARFTIAKGLPVDEKVLATVHKQIEHAVRLMMAEIQREVDAGEYPPPITFDGEDDHF